jgi:acetyl esterase/lipase
MHRKLRQAGVESAFEVFEGQPHDARYRDASVPESKDAEIARFFDKDLGGRRARRARDLSRRAGASPAVP